jgi:hypothetical protein
MTFKTQLAADLDHMLDTDVFADTFVIDGVSVAASLQEVSFQELGPAFDGLLGKAAKLYAKAADLAGEYAPGSVMVIDDETWEVTDQVIEAGMRVISLHQVLS